MIQPASLSRLIPIALLILTACATTPETSTQQDAQPAANDTDKLIGAPPQSQDDPYFTVVARPADAIPMPTTGTVEPRETPTKVPENQCFSCIKICQIDQNNNESCADNPEDIICGWGTAQTSADAQNVAVAQCDNMLNMARHMPIYSTIEGQCPPATCRE